MNFMATSVHPVHPLVGNTAGSAELHEEAAHYLPGAATANIKYFDPYPIAMESASGARMKDVDGNEYIDYNLCYGALMLGHGDPRVKKAVLEQLNRMGTTRSEERRVGKEGGERGAAKKRGNKEIRASGRGVRHCG